MKKLLILSLLLISAPSIFAANFAQKATLLAKIIKHGHIVSFTKVCVDFYKNRNLYRNQGLRSYIESRWTEQRIASLEQELGTTVANIKAQQKPRKNIFGEEETSAASNFSFKPFESLTKQEQLLFLSSKTLIPFNPEIEEVLVKSTPLLKTGLLSQIPGTDEYNGSQKYDHITQLVARVGSPELKQLLYPVKK